MYICELLPRVHAPFQRNTLLLFTFGTIEQCHVKKVYDLFVRLDRDYLLNSKPLDLNTSLTSCFFFSMCLGVAFFLCALESLCTQKWNTVIAVQPHFIWTFKLRCYQ